MKAFFIMVRAELSKQDAKVSLSKNDEVIETLGADSPHESFCVGVTVWATRLDSRGLHAI